MRVSAGRRSARRSVYRKLMPGYEVPDRGPVVSTVSLDEGEAARCGARLARGFAGRERARLRDPAVMRRIGDALAKLNGCARRRRLANRP